MLLVAVFKNALGLSFATYQDLKTKDGYIKRAKDNQYVIKTSTIELYKVMNYDDIYDPNSVPDEIINLD